MYWDDIDDRGGDFKRNTKSTKKFRAGLIVKLLDIKNNFGNVERGLVESEYDLNSTGRSS